MLMIYISVYCLKLQTLSTDLRPLYHQKIDGQLWQSHLNVSHRFSLAYIIEMPHAVTKIHTRPNAYYRCEVSFKHYLRGTDGRIWMQLRTTNKLATGARPFLLIIAHNPQKHTRTRV